MRPTAEAVLPLLTGRLGRPYRFVEECASTQRLIGPEAPEGETVVADHQTEGRGRLGRDWVDEPATSVLMSVCLRPQVESARLPELTVVAAGVVADAIAAETGLAPALKHPNDVLVDGRKVAGVLAEASELRAELCAELAGLPADQARVVVLKDALGFSFEEISEESGMPVGTAKCYAHRARNRLRDRLGEVA